MPQYLRLCALSGMASGVLLFCAGSFGAARPAASVLADAPPVNVIFGTGAPVPDTQVGKTVTAQYFFGTLTTPIVVTGASLSGPNAASFSILKNTCANGVVLQGSTTCEVDVQFTPH